MKLPVIRGGERATFKRCPKKWYWAWRMGFIPRVKSFGALDLGTWWHAALAEWYGKGFKRTGNLAEIFVRIAEEALIDAIEAGAPEHVIEKAEELIALGEAMAVGYMNKYGNDPGIRVVMSETHLEFTIPDENGKPIINHRLTPDLVYLDAEGLVWMMEHKTAKSISTEHLAIDDQARPYSAMAQRALIKAGLIQANQPWGGMMYSYTRKALPDERLQNEQGQYLNQNGSVSKRQPPAFFYRKPIRLSKKAKILTLQRVQRESLKIASVSARLRTGKIDPKFLQKTPHHSCPRTCEFFAMCVAEEEGSDIRSMAHEMFRRQNPYETPETTDDTVGFEMS